MWQIILKNLAWRETVSRWVPMPVVLIVHHVDVLVRVGIVFVRLSALGDVAARVGTKIEIASKLADAQIPQGCWTEEILVLLDSVEEVLWVWVRRCLAAVHQHYIR